MLPFDVGSHADVNKSLARVVEELFQLLSNATRATVTGYAIRTLRDGSFTEFRMET